MEDSIWRKQKCYVLFQINHVKNAPSIAVDIIIFVFTPSIGDIWKILKKISSRDPGRQNLNQGLKYLRHCHPVPNGSHLMTILKGRKNDTQF
jgi:hypothetical protein